MDKSFLIILPTISQTNGHDIPALLSGSWPFDSEKRPDVSRLSGRRGKSWTGYIRSKAKHVTVSKRSCSGSILGDNPNSFLSVCWVGGRAKSSVTTKSYSKDMSK